MGDTTLTWISMSEAQLALGRCESTVRRLIRKHNIRTKKVLVEKGQEIRLCLEDVRELLPDDAPALQAGPLAVVPSNHDLAAPVEADQVREVFEGFHQTMKILAQTSAAQLEILERMSVRLDSSTRERGDVSETQRQLSDSLANINRTAKAQAAALLDFGDRLKEQNTDPRPWLWPAVAGLAVLLGIAVGAGTLYFMNDLPPLGPANAAQAGHAGNGQAPAESAPSTQSGTESDGDVSIGQLELEKAQLMRTLEALKQRQNELEARLSPEAETAPDNGTDLAEDRDHSEGTEESAGLIEPGRVDGDGTHPLGTVAADSSSLLRPEDSSEPHSHD